MQDNKKALRVVAYCRVSTDKDDQVNSLSSQKRYFTEYIQRNPMWELIDVYADEGVTGTSTKKRHAFNQMIRDAEIHKFDLIITKEISRFARNTLDSIFYTRKLKDLGVGVLFMNDNINTLDADSELRLTIMSSIAQEESRKTSDRVKWGQKRQMEQGVVFGRDMLGYDVHNGKLIINESGAEVVRLIFSKFVNENKGTHIIARELREAGIPTSTYMKQWSNTVILRTLRNEKYCGDLIQKKTFTPSYLSHEKKSNNGEEEFVVLRNHHEPIISRDLFEKAQMELQRRSPTNAQKSKYSNRYCFSGKIKCGVCKSSYVSRTKNRKDGSIYKAWRCLESAKNGSKHIDKSGDEVGCNNHSINDDDLKLIMMQVVKNLPIDKEALISSLNSIVSPIVNLKQPMENSQNFQRQVKLLTGKKKSLLELYLDGNISKDDFKEMNKKYEVQIYNLKKQINANNLTTQTIESNSNLQSEVINTINNLTNGGEWSDTFYRNIIDKIIIYDNNTIEVTLSLLETSFRYLVCKSSQLQ